MHGGKAPSLRSTDHYALKGIPIPSVLKMDGGDVEDARLTGKKNLSLGAMFACPANSKRQSGFNMRRRTGPHANVMGRLGLGNGTIPHRVDGVYQKAALDEPQVCLKCFARVFRQNGRQFTCLLCGEDVWLVTPRGVRP